MQMNNSILAIISLSFVVQSTHAGAGRIEADSEGVFTKYRCSVIVARVEKVLKQPLGDGQLPQERAILVPKSTLAGTFDPSGVETLSVELPGTGANTSVPVAPKEGDLVLAVVRVQVLVHDDPTPRNLVVAEDCMFMPERAALVVLKTLDDVRIGETLERIRSARAKAGQKPRN